MIRRCLVFLLLTGFLAAAVNAGDPEDERLFLKNGDRLTGTREGEHDGLIHWKTPFGDVLKVPADQVEKIEFPEDVKPAVVPAPPPEPAVPPPAVPAPPTPEQIEKAQVELAHAAELQAELEHPWNPLTIGKRLWNAAGQRVYDWTKRVTFGARYVTGNSDETMVNSQIDLERKAKLANVQIQGGGQFGKSNGVLGTNRWYVNSTTDFNTSEKLIWFMKHTDEYDQFQNLDYRGTLSGGLGYRFFNEDKKRLIVRLGPAGTYENFRDPDNERFAFDLFGELESRWPLAKRIQFEQKATVYPNTDDWDRIRVTATANLVISLDERECWHLQFGVQDQYFSRPNPGREPHDLTTNLSLVYQKK